MPILGCQVQWSGVVGVCGILGLPLQQGNTQMAVEQQLGHLHETAVSNGVQVPPTCTLPVRVSSLGQPTIPHPATPFHPQPQAWLELDSAWHGHTIVRGCKRSQQPEIVFP